MTATHGEMVNHVTRLVKTAKRCRAPKLLVPVLANCMAVAVFSLTVVMCWQGNMHRAVGESLWDHTQSFAVAISAVHAPDSQPLMFAEEVYETLQRGGMTNSSPLLQKIQSSYPGNLTSGVVLEKAIADAVETASGLEPMHTKMPLAFTDMGLPLFYTVGVELLGPSISSPFWLMVILIGISIAIYIVAFWRKPLPSVALLFVVAGLFLWARFLVNNPQETNLISLAGLRSLSLVGIVAFLFLVTILISDRPIPYAMQFGVVFQSLLLWIAATSRSSFMWAIVIVCALLLLRPWISSRRNLSRPERWQGDNGLATLVLAVGFLAIASVEVRRMSEAPKLDTSRVSRLVDWSSYTTSALAIGVIGLSLFFLYVILRFRQRNIRGRLTNYNTSLTTALIALSFVVPQVISWIAIPSIYFTADVQPQHLRWHNAVIGLEASPYASTIFQDLANGGVQIGGDTTGFAASFFAFEKEFPEVTSPSLSQESWYDRASRVGWTSTVTGTFKARTTDLFAQRAFFQYLRSYPLETALAYPEKIKDFFVNTSSILFQSFLPLGFGLLTGAVGFVAGYRKSRDKSLSIRIAQQCWLLALFMSSLGVLSSLPLIWAYPAIHAMAESFVMVSAAMLALLLAAGISIGDAFRQVTSSYLK